MIIYWKILNPDEAEKVYSTILALSDILGLDKYVKYGGMHKLNTTRAEYRKMSVGPKDLPELSHIATLNTAAY